MKRKTLSTLLLLVILLIVGAIGSVYTYYFQAGEIDENKSNLKSLKLDAMNTEDLEIQLVDLKHKVVELDSILALRKYIIPVQIPQSNFFKFVNKISSNFSENSFVDLEYLGQGKQKNFSSYSYGLKGTAEFNDLFKLIYSIEQSKELKKVVKGSLTNFIEVDDDGLAHYLVNYNLKIIVYYADNDTYASAKYNENKLHSNSLYNIFYPLIRDEIPPNTENLLDVQAGQLLALIPDGAYIADASGKTHLLWEGDEIYLGYLTKIDYVENEVKFILNKGGVIEKITLKLEQSHSDNDKKLTSK